MGLLAEQVSGTTATPRETRSPSSADLGACGKDILVLGGGGDEFCPLMATRSARLRPWGALGTASSGVGSFRRGKVIRAVQPLRSQRRKWNMGSIPLAAAASRGEGGCFGELARGRSARLVKLAVLPTGQNQAEAGGRAMGCRPVYRSSPCRAFRVPRLGRVVVSWRAAVSRGLTLAAWWGRP